MPAKRPISMSGAFEEDSESVTTLAGTTLTSGSTDATGTNAKFNSAPAITTDGTNLYVADSSN